MPQYTEQNCYYVWLWISCLKVVYETAKVPQNIIIADAGSWLNQCLKHYTACKRHGQQYGRDNKKKRLYQSLHYEQTLGGGGEEEEKGA